jgi:hypothetical protein
MHTLKLNINDSVFDRFLWLLGKFNKEEIEIISDDEDFLITKKYLQAEMDEINSGNAKFYTFEETDLILEKVIVKHAKR